MQIIVKGVSNFMEPNIQYAAKKILGNKSFREIQTSDIDFMSQTLERYAWILTDSNNANMFFW